MDFRLNTPKGFMAAVFCTMAVPCLLAPDFILSTFISKRLQPATGEAKELSHLLVRCFGSQALLSGVAISLGKWDRSAHKVWLGAIAPFFVFDLMAWRADMLTPLGAIGDALGNVVFVACSTLALELVAGSKQQ